MIRCQIDTRNGEIIGFRVLGHAGFRDIGSDIVCAAVSVLVINTINSCEALLGVEPECQDNGEVLTCAVPAGNDSIQLLFRAMVYGLNDIMKLHPDHVVVHTKES